MMVNTAGSQCLNKLNIALNVLFQELTLECDPDYLSRYISCISSQLSSLPRVLLVCIFSLCLLKEIGLASLTYIEEI